MASALILLSTGFEEIEAITVIDLLRRASIKVITAGLHREMIIGSHQVPIKPDRYYEDCNPDEYDILILPGGQPGTNNIKSNPTIITWIQKRHKAKKWMAAVCAAPIAFQEAGITAGLNLTSYPTEKEVFQNSIYSESPVVVDNHIITSRGVGTSIDFALVIIENLVNKQVADDIADRILYSRPTK